MAAWHLLLVLIVLAIVVLALFILSHIRAHRAALAAVGRPRCARCRQMLDLPHQRRCAECGATMLRVDKTWDDLAYLRPGQMFWPLRAVEGLMVGMILLPFAIILPIVAQTWLPQYQSWRRDEVFRIEGEPTAHQVMVIQRVGSFGWHHFPPSRFSTMILTLGAAPTELRMQRTDRGWRIDGEDVPASGLQARIARWMEMTSLRPEPRDRLVDAVTQYLNRGQVPPTIGAAGFAIETGDWQRRRPGILYHRAGRTHSTLSTGPMTGVILVLLCGAVWAVYFVRTRAPAWSVGPVQHDTETAQR